MEAAYLLLLGRHNLGRLVGDVRKGDPDNIEHKEKRSDKVKTLHGLLLLNKLDVAVTVGGESVRKRRQKAKKADVTHVFMIEVHEPAATMAWRKPRKSTMKVTAEPKKMDRGATALPMR